MVSDPEPRVRLEVAQRLAPDMLARMRDDPDWRVRYEVAEPDRVGDIGELADDEDELVRETARAPASAKTERLKGRPHEQYRS